MAQVVAPLTAAQTATLRAALDRIIPPDDYPGGWEGGVGDYLRRQFAGDLAAAVPVYCTGLDALDSVARSSSGRDFATLPAAEQEALLEAIEAGGHGALLTTFFATLVAHAMEGYYGDPGNGGNIDGRSWAMIGFEVRG